MNTENIKVIFSDYLKADKTQYAILLNGTWGCGKTYFWKYSLSKIAENSNFKVIYISLNGISKIDALEHLLFLKLIPFMGKKEGSFSKNAMILVTNLLNNTSQHLLKTSLTDIFKGVSVDMFDFKKYVICFDDLERCQIPIKEVLGFINNYVEHKSLKTIILADENNIDPNQKEKGYDNIKEKVIGRVLNFELNILEILPDLLKKYETYNLGFYNFLLRNKKVIAEILTDYKQDNLRIISFYLDVLERVSPAILNIEEKHIQEIILFTAIITIEFKKGNLMSADYKNPNGIDSIDESYYSRNMAQTLMETKSDKEIKERKKSYTEVFYETYLFKRIKNFYYYQSIYSYILSGYINLSELETEIKRRQPEIISQHILDFRKLLDYKFRELSDHDFKKLTEDVLKFSKEGKYSIYDYVQIANFFYFFSKNQLIPESIAEINKLLIGGIEIAKKRNEISDSILENLLHFNDDDPNLTKIKGIIKTKHFEIKKAKSVAESKALIDSLANDNDNALAEIFEKQKFSKEFLMYIDNKSLFIAITKTSNRQIFRFTELLRDRYKSVNIGEFLLEDIECLTTLKSDLEDYVHKKSNLKQPKKYLLISLVEALKSICAHLDKTKKA